MADPTPKPAGAAAAAARQRVDKMSSEVVDSNPYSRLMALQRMGIVKDYEKIRTKTVCKLWPPAVVAASLTVNMRPAWLPRRWRWSAWAAWAAWQPRC